MSTLSIFVDESGDFGSQSTYYIITMIFHDQKNSIQDEINKLNDSLRSIGYSNPVIHTEPLIRKEEDYSNLPPNERRAILSKLFFFIKHADISYKSFVYEKRVFEDSMKLEARIARDISLFIRDNLQHFLSFDIINLYYDNGQREVTRILNSVFATELTNYDVRKVFPWQYKLFQVADFICTMSLIEKKIEFSDLSRSEKLIFHSKKALLKDYIKPLKKKIWGNLR